MDQEAGKTDGGKAARKKMRAAVAGARPADHIISRHPGDALYGLPDGCPVTPLGLAGSDRFYLDTEKQLIRLAAKDHTRLQLNGLFGRQMEFVYSWSPWTRKNAEGIVTGWRPEAVCESFMKACGQAGVWDPNQRERGRGAWLGDDGELILHTGDQVMAFGTYNPWGLRIVKKPGMVGRYVYPASERIPGPADTDDDADAAHALLALLETWSWRRPNIDPALLLGWIAAAMIGGALKWRPVIWLTGGKGTGKSTLQKAIENLLGGSILALADTTAAAIWQTLQRQTLPVAVDELEAAEDNRRSMEVIKLARIAASGGKMARGSDKHTAHEFVLQSCFVFSSVLVPPLAGPDRSRIAMLELDELDPAAPEPDLTPTRLREIGAHIQRQLILGWPRWQTTLAYYRTMLGGDGHSKRGADQFGTLLACADLALFGANEDRAAASVWLDQMQLAGLMDLVDDQRDEDQCLQHLLGSPVDVHRGGTRTNLGEWINRAAGRCQDFDDPRGAAKLIQSYGVRYEVVPPAGPGGRTSYWLAVACNHAGLATLFERTRWQTPRGVTGVWVQALRRLAGAERSSAPLYFGGSNSRAVLLPLALIPAPDSEELKPIFDAQMR